MTLVAGARLFSEAALDIEGGYQSGDFFPRKSIAGGTAHGKFKLSLWAAMGLRMLKGRGKCAPHKHRFCLDKLLPEVAGKKLGNGT